MPPELVVAGAAYKVYPGGVVALRCSDWIGDSAGASVESDARAIEGEVVRETQTYAGAMSTIAQRTTAINAMDDTLTIDTSLIPWSAITGTGDFDPPEFFYSIFFSALIEGDWDPAATTGYGSTPLAFSGTSSANGVISGTGPNIALVSWFGDTLNPTAHGQLQWSAYLRNCPQYRMYGGTDYIWIQDATEVIHIRAFSASVHNIEILLDQIIFMPEYAVGTDTMPISPAFSSFAGRTNPIDDGSDGGLGGDNGIYTWHPRRSMLEPTGGVYEVSDWGGGDYQQEDSEYLVDVAPGDDVDFGSWFDGSAHPAQYAYSCVGAIYREVEVYENDDFSRTETGTFGFTPNGYFYRHNSPPANTTYAVNGSQGQIHHGGSLPRASTAWQWILGNVSDTHIESTDMIYSGKITIHQQSGLPIADGSTTELSVFTGFLGGQNAAALMGPGYAIHFDFLNWRWRLVNGRRWANTVTSHVLSYTVQDVVNGGWNDISSWWDMEVELAFKIEIRRFLIRCKVWEASGSEPAAWDYEDFHAIWDNRLTATPVWVEYPYTSAAPGSPVLTTEIFAQAWQHAASAVWRDGISPFAYGGGTGYIAQFDVFFDDLVFEYDPYGDTANVHAMLENPVGNEFGQIEVPSTAWHFVYWGVAQFSENVGGFGVLRFAAKSWNSSGAADLQRAEMPINFFIWSPGFKIVSMNWRIADRSGVATRVLTGG